MGVKFKCGPTASNLVGTGLKAFLPWQQTGLPHPREHMSITRDPWVRGLTIGEALRRRARDLPEHEALVFPQYRFRATFSEYDALVDEAAKGLLAMGIEHGDHVAVWGTNRPEWVLLQLATARIGAVLVAVNPAYRGHELAYVLQQSDARALFLIDRFKSSDYFGILGDVCPELASSEPGELGAAQYPHLRWVVSLTDHAPAGMTTWSSIIELGKGTTDEALRMREASVDVDEPINLQYTSGTTGVPQGRIAEPPQPAAQRLLRGCLPESRTRTTGSACRCRSTTASAASSAPCAASYTASP